jgi:ABC-2 type transport system permease protein
MLLLRIMRQDWRSLSADRTLWAVAALLVLTIGYGAYNGAAWVRFQQQTLQAAAAEEQKRLEAVKAGIAAIEAGHSRPASPFRDPRSPSAVGRTLAARYAVMPPGPLAALAVGQSDLYPYYFKVSTSSKQTFLQNDEIENPVHLLSGRFDLAFVILYLYPLIILALTYNVLSAEKEAGTLAMTLSQPVSLRTLVAAKVTTRAAFIVCLSLAVSVLGVSLGGTSLWAEGAWIRLALWMAVVIAYGAFWFSLAVAVNALGRTSATNAMVLAGVWLAFVLVIPALLNLGVKVLHPVPSRVELIQAMREASSEASAQSSKLLAGYLEDHPELSGGNADEFGVIAVAAQAYVEREMQPVLERFDLQLDRQQALVDRYRFLSPAIVAQSSLNDVAGTSVFRYKHFLSQVDDFHREWRAFFHPRIVRKHRLRPEELGELPQFAFREEPAQAVVSRSVAGLAGLLAPVLLVTALGLGRLRRYPVAG